MPRPHTGRCVLHAALFAALSLALACEEGPAPEVSPPPGGEPGEQPGGPDGADAYSGLPPGIAEPDAGQFVPGLPPAEIDCPEDAPIEPGPAMMRRLTRFEYHNTVRDLLGIEIMGEARPSERFAPEEESLGFNNQAASLQISVLHAEQFMEASELLGALVTEAMRSPEGLLDRHLGCDPGVDDEDACFEGFVRTFGQRAWRRPLDDEEATRLSGFLDLARDMVASAEGSDEDPFLVGVELVVQALLQSPYFLFRVEIGQPVEGRPDLVELNGWEVASRLSYLIWQSMPDEALFVAAATGALDEPEGVLIQARRMLADEKARPAVIEFFDQWLEVAEVAHLNRDLEYYPSYVPELRDDWANETHRFVEHLIFSGEASLAELFTARYSFLNARLARLYGVEGVEGEDFAKTELDPARRSGVLTQGAILAATAKPNMTSPVFRGLFVRERMLCDQMPPPPPDIVVVPPDPDPTASTRDKFQQHSADPACVGCHVLMDPVGFGLENFDAIGVWRDREGQFPIDARGELIATLDINGPFDGPIQLAERLSGSEQVQRCITRQYFRYAMGRVDTRDDACTLEGLHDTYVDGHDFLAVIEHLAGSDALRYRRVQEEEGSP